MLWAHALSRVLAVEMDLQSHFLRQQACIATFSWSVSSMCHASEAHQHRRVATSSKCSNRQEEMKTNHSSVSTIGCFSARCILMVLGFPPRHGSQMLKTSRPPLQPDLAGHKQFTGSSLKDRKMSQSVFVSRRCSSNLP